MLSYAMPACDDGPSPEMEVDDVVFVKSQLGESVDWAAEQLKCKNIYNICKMRPGKIWRGQERLQIHLPRIHRPKSNLHLHQELEEICRFVQNCEKKILPCVMWEYSAICALSLSIRS